MTPVRPAAKAKPQFRPLLLLGFIIMAVFTFVSVHSLVSGDDDPEQPAAKKKLPCVGGGAAGAELSADVVTGRPGRPPT